MVGSNLGAGRSSLTCIGGLGALFSGSRAGRIVLSNLGTVCSSVGVRGRRVRLLSNTVTGGPGGFITLTGGNVVCVRGGSTSGTVGYLGRTLSTGRSGIMILICLNTYCGDGTNGLRSPGNHGIICRRTVGILSGTGRLSPRGARTG